MENRRIFMNNEVELFKEDDNWFVTDCDAKGYCERHYTYEKARLDYEKRVRIRVEKHYTKTSKSVWCVCYV